MGILETSFQSVLLLIAIRVFQADSSFKAILALGMPLGMLASPFLLNLAARRGLRLSRTAAGAILAGGIFFLVGVLAIALMETSAGLQDWQVAVYVPVSLIFIASTTVIVPLLTQLYQNNYPSSERGKLFTGAALIRIAVASIFGIAAGRLLELDLGNYLWILFIYIFAQLGNSFCISNYPAESKARVPEAKPFDAFKYLKSDKTFRRVIIAQMLLGIGFMMVVPQRVEYVANEKYGLNFTEERIMFLTVVIPGVARFLFSRLWGILFDRMNFFVLRLILNLMSASGLAIFFATPHFTVILIGVIIIGTTMAGGEVAWNLWVTKVAPPDKVGDYMSVNTLLTGVRGMFAFPLGYVLASFLSLQMIAGISITLILLACLEIVLELKELNERRKNIPPTPPITSNTGSGSMFGGQ